MPETTDPIGVEEAILSYEVEHPQGYTALELGRALYTLQENGRLKEGLFLSPEQAWEEHLRTRVTAWMARREIKVRSLSTRQFLARIDEAATRRTFVWETLPAVAESPEQRQEAVQHCEWVIGVQLPAVLERQLRVYRALGMDTSTLELPFLREVKSIFSRTAAADTLEEAA